MEFAKDILHYDTPSVQAPVVKSQPKPYSKEQIARFQSLADKGRQALAAADAERAAVQEAKTFIENQGKMRTFTSPADLFSAIGVDPVTFEKRANDP